jgi:hypothetical protein
MRIEPLIWKSMILPAYWEDDDHAFMRLRLYDEPFKTKPKEFFSKYVRRVYTSNVNTSWGDRDFELQLLPICDNLTTLECWSYGKAELRTILKTKYWPKLKTLCINLDLLPLDENTFHLPLFRHVTKLDFQTEKQQLPSWKSLESLENLTHMRVNMLLETDFKDFRPVIDQAYNIAVEAQKHFPKTLECFVILVPLFSLYYFSNQPRVTSEDEARWERIEAVRLGTFDPRIMLGSTDDSWNEVYALCGKGGSGQVFNEYLELIPNLDHQDCPQAWQYFGSWEPVKKKYEKRKRALASEGPPSDSSEKVCSSFCCRQPRIYVLTRRLYILFSRLVVPLIYFENFM